VGPEPVSQVGPARSAEVAVDDQGGTGPEQTPRDDQKGNVHLSYAEPVVAGARHGLFPVGTNGVYHRIRTMVTILVVLPLVVLYFFSNEAAHREHRSRHHVRRSRPGGFGPGLWRCGAKQTAAQGDHLSRYKFRERPL
jgi:hypothetical protein